jgi:hypothetical protein
MILAMLLLVTPPLPADVVPTADTVVPAAAPAAENEPNPKKMSQSAIRAHNAELPRDHPYYIRCVKSEETGSLVKRNFSCRTNQQWSAAEDAANAEARAIADEMSSKGWRTSG